MVDLQSEVPLVSSFSVDFAYKKDFLNGLIYPFVLLYKPQYNLKFIPKMQPRSTVFSFVVKLLRSKSEYKLVATLLCPLRSDFIRATVHEVGSIGFFKSHFPALTSRKN